jgi:flagellar motor protein MotB
MAKKKSGGSPAWMTTFADLMSLLLTFFLLMLSFSTMDQVKYKKMIGSFKDAFGIQQQLILAGIIEKDGSVFNAAINTTASLDLSAMMEVGKLKEPTEDETEENAKINIAPSSKENPQDASQEIKKLEANIRDVVSAFASSGLISVSVEGQSLLFTFPSRLIDMPEDGKLNTAKVSPVLAELLGILEPFLLSAKRPIKVLSFAAVQAQGKGVKTSHLTRWQSSILQSYAVLAWFQTSSKLPTNWVSMGANVHETEHGMDTGTVRIVIEDKPLSDFPSITF